MESRVIKLLQMAGYDVHPNQHVALSWVQHRDCMYLDAFVHTDDDKPVFVVEIDANMHGPMRQ